MAERWSDDLNLLWAVCAFAAELCEAVDREAEDIGGCRPSLEIIRDLGTALDDAKTDQS